MFNHTGLKAQFTMRTLLEVGLMLIVYSQIYPFLIEAPLQTLIANSDPVTAALLSLLPFVIIAVIIIGVLGYNSIGGRQR
jgi:cytochrome bd-type quinol oxidase subunit 2